MNIVNCQINKIIKTFEYLTLHPNPTVTKTLVQSPMTFHRNFSENVMKRNIFRSNFKTSYILYKNSN